jgi:predicted DNA-binding transcriptional regulator AlpA
MQTREPEVGDYEAFVRGPEVASLLSVTVSWVYEQAGQSAPNTGGGLPSTPLAAVRFPRPGPA